MKIIRNIVLIGAGNVATNLGISLKQRKFRIIQVYSRTIEAANALAGQLNAEAINDPAQLDKSAADIYIFCLSDSAIRPFLQETSFSNQLLVHTSGSIGLDVFRGFSENFGVLYPVQTFIKQRIIDLRNVPLCVEANKPENEKTISGLANNISAEVIPMNSARRKILHVAAVFACNFPNHMYDLSAKILEKQEIPFNLLKPLILETALRSLEMDPEASQTGPAVRGDLNILEEHIRLLEDYPELQKMYTFVSDSIHRHYFPDDD